MIKLPPDITFVIQLVSFLVFWQLMRWALFKPVQGVLRARAERTTGDKARAEKLRGEAAGILEDVNAALGDARREGTRRADEIRHRGEAKEHEILARYRGQAAALLERERALTAAQVEAARTPLRAEAELIASSVVAKVLGRPV
jgi:F0F1-type ATP synthase membrane subunit b/b'